MTRVQRGIGAQILSSLAFPAMDAATRGALGNLPVPDAVLWRTTLIFVLLAILLPARGGRSNLVATMPGIMALRSLTFATTSILIVVSLKYLTMAETFAVYFISPVLTVLLAAPLLGEPVTRRAAGAATVGFVGVLLVIQPRSEGVNPAYFIPLLAAFTGALQDVLARKLRGTLAPTGLLFYGICVTLVACLVLMAGRAPMIPAGMDWLLLATSAVSGVVAFLFVIVSYQLAPTAIIAPLRYMNLVMSVLFGYVIWRNVPNTLAWAGMALILVAGVVCVLPSRRALKESLRA